MNEAQMWPLGWPREEGVTSELGTPQDPDSRYIPVQLIRMLDDDLLDTTVPDTTPSTRRTAGGRSRALCQTMSVNLLKF
jgi:hypothetical protein